MTAVTPHQDLMSRDPFKAGLFLAGSGGLLFCRWLHSHVRMDSDLENVIRQALADAQAAGWAYLS